jgi:oxygen-dependent protoporphyrinogen oxidase
VAVRVAVVGGGISGLAAARALVAAGHEPVVLEAAARVGGPLRVSEVAGVPVDEGADAFLVRTGAARDLAELVGAEVVHPAAREAQVLVHGRLVPLPRTLLGVPLDLRTARPALGSAGTARAAADLLLPPTPYDGDTAVGTLVRRRLGAAVADRLLEPLLGGVYAGHADHLSMAATLPQLHDPAGTSLLRRARAATGPRSDAPVFGSLAAGLGTLPALAAAGLDVRLGQQVRAVRRTPTGWALETRIPGERGRGEQLTADAVVLALPAAGAARLLAPLDPRAAALAGAPAYASVAIVTLALPRETAGLLRDTTHSGWLAPPGSGVVKAVTVTSAKWAHVRTAAPGLVHVRASVGRAGEERELQRDDRELVGVVAAEVAAVSGARGPVLDSRVTRWGGALPQYAPGHLDRVAELRRLLPPGLVVCGAAYDGVGIPACIASGQRAATLLSDRLGTRGH